MLDLIAGTIADAVRERFPAIKLDSRIIYGRIDQELLLDSNKLLHRTGYIQYCADKIQFHSYLAGTTVHTIYYTDHNIVERLLHLIQANMVDICC